MLTVRCILKAADECDGKIVYSGNRYKLIDEIYFCDRERLEGCDLTVPAKRTPQLEKHKQTYIFYKLEMIECSDMFALKCYKHIKTT